LQQLSQIRHVYSLFQDNFMALKNLVFSFPLLVLSTQIYADSTLDAAIGGGLGGAAGAAIGNELGGRQGAIVGGAIGGATGAAIATDDNHDHHHTTTAVDVNYKPAVNTNNNNSFCPPGQRKKGRC
jgi:outer membrane lipoprotein SlyB